MSNTKQKTNNDNTVKTVKMCILLIIGILFCLSILLGERNLSIILGVGFICAGVALVTVSLLKEKELLSSNALIGFIVIALGIISITEPIVHVILMIVPYIYIVFGCAVFADAFLAKFVRKGKTYEFVLKLIFGIVAITLGILLITVADISTYTGLFFGLTLVVIAIYSITTIVLEANKSKKQK